MRDRKRPTAYVTAEPYRDVAGVIAGTEGRWIVLSTGRGDVRIDWAEAGVLIQELSACRREVALRTPAGESLSDRPPEGA
jgi:hypothetical protein